MSFPILDMPASDILHLHSLDKLWIVHNERTFEPYFYLVDKKEWYMGDNKEVWDYIELYCMKRQSYRRKGQ